MHCQWARLLWEIILAIVGIEWVSPFSVRHTLLSWQGARVRKKCKKLWRATPLCLFWTVWCERNKVTFDNEVFSVHRLKRSPSNVYRGDTYRHLLGFLTWMGYT